MGMMPGITSLHLTALLIACCHEGRVGRVGQGMWVTSSISIVGIGGHISTSLPCQQLSDVVGHVLLVYSPASASL